MQGGGFQAGGEPKAEPLMDEARAGRIFLTGFVKARFWKLVKTQTVPRQSIAKIVSAAVRQYPDILHETIGGQQLTALHIASQAGKLDLMRELVNAGARVNAIDQCGNTSLHLATGASDIAAATELVTRLGADVSIKNAGGQRAIDLLIEPEKEVWLRELLEVRVGESFRVSPTARKRWAQARIKWRVRQASNAFEEEGWDAVEKYGHRHFLLDDHELDHFKCPITRSFFRDPVVAADGHTYERREIERLLRTSEEAVSPLTREPLTGTMLIPNRVMQQGTRKLVQKVRHTQHFPLRAALEEAEATERALHTAKSTASIAAAKAAQQAVRAAGAASKAVAQWKAQAVRRIYLRHAPARLEKVPALIERYGEDELLAKVMKKYLGVSLSLVDSRSRLTRMIDTRMSQQRQCETGKSEGRPSAPGLLLFTAGLDNDHQELFTCPMSPDRLLFSDPVITSTGNSYERAVVDADRLSSANIHYTNHTLRNATEAVAAKAKRELLAAFDTGAAESVSAPFLQALERKREVVNKQLREAVFEDLRNRGATEDLIQSTRTRFEALSFDQRVAFAREIVAGTS